MAGDGDITVWINSPGGDCVAAAQIYNMLMDYPHNVTVKIDGIAASAASVIAMAGDMVCVSPVAMMMIHNPATMAMGEAKDMQKAIAAAGDGQLLVPSFQGSRVEGMDREAYIADHVTTAHLVAETGAGLMEMNTSCPNEGHNRLLCHDPHLVGEITEAVKNEIGDRPLIVKLAYIPNDADLEIMVKETAGHGAVQGFSTINTISAKLVDANGNQALPGAGRDRSGVCGNAIRGAGLDMVGRLNAIREKLGLDFAIVGVGGVIRPEDYKAYREAGANAVMSATGAMWNARLAQDIKAAL